MIWIVGIFCLSLFTHFGDLVEISDGDKRIERAILGGGGDNHLPEVLGGGSPGRDFPVLNTVPRTNFDCTGLLPGYYADEDYGCQVFHVCHGDHRKDSFLCPNGTIFHQVKLVCDWWYNVDCASTNLHFDVNLEFGKPSSNFNSGGPSKKFSQPVVASEKTQPFQSGGGRISGQTLQPTVGSGGSRFSQAGGSSSQFSQPGGSTGSSQFSQSGGTSSQFSQLGGGSTGSSHFSQSGGSTGSSQFSQPGRGTGSGQSSHFEGSSGGSQFSSGNRGNVQQSQFGGTSVPQSSLFGIDSGVPLPSQFSGNHNDVPTQSQPFGIPKVDPPRSNSFNAPSQPAFNSVSSRAQQQHHSSFQTSQIKPQTNFGSRQGSSRLGNNQITNNKHIVKEVKVNKRPITATGIPLPSNSQRQSDNNLAQRSGRILPNVPKFEEDPVPTTISPRNNNFQVPNSLLSPPSKTDSSGRFSQKNNFGNSVSKLPQGRVPTVKKVTVNKRPINSFGPKEVTIIDDTNAANQFFNLGKPVSSRNNLGIPLPQIDVKKQTPTRTQTNVRTISSNVGKPIPQVKIKKVTNQNFKPIPSVQATTGRTTTTRARTTHQTGFGKPLPLPQPNVRTNNQNQNLNVGRPLPPVNTVQSNNFGRPLPAVRSQGIPLPPVPAVPQVRTTSRNRGSVRFNTSPQQGATRGSTQRGQATPQPQKFHIFLDDDDDLDDLNDPFDDDRFDDDRFDDDRFDNDRFDDDRFDDDRFDDDRFKTNTKFGFQQSKFDDDRFDNDPFDDDRFDFDDDDDDDDDFDDRRNKFDNDNSFNFGRRPRGSSSTLLVALNQTTTASPILVKITPPPEIQLPPPLLHN